MNWKLEAGLVTTLVLGGLYFGCPKDLDQELIQAQNERDLLENENYCLSRLSDLATLSQDELLELRDYCVEYLDPSLTTMIEERWSFLGVVERSEINFPNTDNLGCYWHLRNFELSSTPFCELLDSCTYSKALESQILRSVDYSGECL